MPSFIEVNCLVALLHESIMFKPEYRVGFLVLKREIGLLPTLRIVISAILKSFKIDAESEQIDDKTNKTKTRIKNYFKLLALMYERLQRQYGRDCSNEIMQKVLMEGGQVFFRGFKPLRLNDDLTDFTKIYKNFESNNIVFDVIEESEQRFEIVIRRCLIYESFIELGLEDLSKWMCDIAFNYFSNYHPRMKYIKDRMIARGDDTCHEVFIWE